MPKIVINEYDLTKAGTGEYANFSVVVPGFLGENADESVFDENGIYECSSQTDFVNNIGKRAAQVTTSRVLVGATAPKIAYYIEYNPNLADAEVEILDEDKNVIGKQFRDSAAYEAALNELLTASENSKSSDVAAIDDEEGDLEGEEGTATTTFSIFYAVANNTDKIGYLCDKKRKYIPLDTTETATQHTLFPTIEDADDEGTLVINPMTATAHVAYYKIFDEDRGVNGITIEDRISHYGNQMAYELLGLGYTVLYKKMSEHNDEKLAELIYAKGTDNKPIIPDYDNGAVVTEANLDPNAFVKDAQGNLVRDVHGEYILLEEVSAPVCELADPNFWECLKDKSTYDFRYLVTGLLTNNDGANTCILEIADHSEEILLDDASISDGRGDCIALIDLDSKAYAGKTQTQAIPALAKEAAKWSSAYAAVFAPYVTYILADDAAYNDNKVFPASFHYLACAANSANNNFNEWYANAGYTRGVAKYTIESTGCKFGEIAIQALEPRFMLKVDKELATDENGDVIEPKSYVDINTTVAINLIVKIKSSYYLWGNRTGKKLGTRGASDGDLVAQHFLNIRQLCTTIKKQVYVTCRRLTFDPNSEILWLNFCSLLRPMLEQMKSDQGIKNYKFIKDPTDRKALLKARIRIVPIEAVEDFEIGLYLEDNLDAVVTEA